MEYPFKNLVFEGGGVKGIAYIGAMEVLEKKGILKSITRVGGASAGAINALLFALGYSIEDTRKILWKLDFRDFEDRSIWPINVLRIFNRFGWFKGDFFKKWIGDLIAEKTGSRHTTFAGISQMGIENGFRQVFMVGTNLSTHFSEIYSAEQTPDMRLADAVRISMSIPLFFKAVRDKRKDVLVDGGVLDNYPIKLFDRAKYLSAMDRETHSFVPLYYAKANQNLQTDPTNPYVYNKETLGFRLDTKEEISLFRDHKPPVAHEITSFADYAKGLIGTMLESQENQHLHSDDWQRSIYIDTLGVKTTDFDLTDPKKDDLYKSGVENTESYFRWYEDMNNNPANRVEDRSKSDLAKLRQLRKKVGRKK